MCFKHASLLLGSTQHHPPFGFRGTRRAFQTVEHFPAVSVTLQRVCSAQYVFMSSCSVVSEREHIGYYHMSSEGRLENGLDCMGNYRS